MYRVDETGVMNNYADMPRAYVARFPGYNEQMAYIRQGTLGLSPIVTACLIAWGVS